MTIDVTITSSTFSTQTASGLDAYNYAVVHTGRSPTMPVGNSTELSEAIVAADAQAPEFAANTPTTGTLY